jgi:hypothetical protein
MPKSQHKPHSPPQAVAESSTLDWRPLKKSRVQFAAAIVLLAVWILFLVVMAVYSQYH